MKKENINLDICITLRCNTNCLNCIKFCNKEDITGLDYSDSDMTMGQINEFVYQIESLNIKNLFASICLTGGEPLLHPDIEKIIVKMEKLKKQEYVQTLLINSNKLIDALPSLQKYIVNYSEPKDNPQKHNVAFLHPSEFSKKIQTYRRCSHYRKNTIVLSYMGYTQCCASDAYIRLFALDELISNHLPKKTLLKKMDKICKHCPFGSDDLVPLEKDMGCPVSDIYEKEADKNRKGRKITKRFPERNK